MEIDRKELHRRWGGRTQGGIGPSKRSPNVFLFSDPVSGEQHGYVDGWVADRYHYTGEGQFGDQRPKSGNASVINHEAEGRHLRLFMGARGRVRYEGEFRVDPSEPYYETDAPESGNPDKLRKVLVFPLLPVDVPPRESSSRWSVVEGAPGVRQVPLEAKWSERFFLKPSADSFEGERREAILVDEFTQWLRRRRHEPSRLMIVPNGEHKPLFTDVWLPAVSLLVEAKGNSTREAFRMAVGQLADYSRFLDPGIMKAILVPSRPRRDLEDLARSQDLIVFWPEPGGGFGCTPEEVAWML